MIQIPILALAKMATMGFKKIMTMNGFVHHHVIIRLQHTTG